MAALQTPAQLPPFEPHPWVRGAHAQTILGRYLPSRPARVSSVEHRVDLLDGDQLVVLESELSGWLPGGPVAVLIHGLGGCARAGYVARLGVRLVEQGWCVVRVNLRGAGAGFGLARGTYHAGRTTDLRALLAWLSERRPDSPIAVVGYSLGGNLALKLAAESAGEPVPGLAFVAAVNPPLDLAASCRAIRAPGNWVYDRNFVADLKRGVRRLHRRFPELGPVDLRRIRSVYEFDDLYTSRRNGFDGADDYYAQSSAGPVVGRITVPGLVVHSDDDPFVPAETVRAARFPPGVRVEITRGGGHLGFLAAGRRGGIWRWLDARLATALAAFAGREATMPV